MAQLDEGPEGRWRRVQVALETAMEKRGVTTTGLAEGAGVERRRIWRWLRGAESMTLDDASRVAELLDLPGDLLIRPPATREGALEMIAEHDAVRRGRGRQLRS